MFDFDAGKLLIIGVVALIVIGPKELPRVLRQVGQMVGRVRRMAAEFQGQFMDAMKEADIQSIRDDLKKIGDDADAQIKVNFDPARDIQRELTSSLESLPAVEAAPALAELPRAATDGFALPPPEATLADVADALRTLGDVGAETAVLEREAEPSGDREPEPEPEPDPMRAPNGAAAALSRQVKRKIIVRKRPPLGLRRTHAVSDRTLPQRAWSLRLRGQEAAER